jgi:2-(3-amino-3-carboxypropyl)histidine synthase
MFDLELNKVVEEIKKRKAKNVLIQLPDGLKPRAKEIADYIEENTNAQPFIWLSSAFGARDIPLGLEALNIDLIIQWGHNKFHKEFW